MILDEILEVMKNNKLNKAYTINGQSYTYMEFYKFVCNIYNYILGTKGPIIVYGHKEIYMKATFLACSFAGITYIPVDNSMPKERINSILEQVKPSLIIGNMENDYCQKISQKEIYEIMNKDNYIDIDQIYLKPEDIYYIIFTSGSTGIPKGVKVTYRNLDSCVNWLKNMSKIENGVILNQANFSFDLSVADLYLSLITGSEHFVIENKNMIDFKFVFEQLKLSGAELAVMTPSFADLLLIDKTFNQDLMPNLKTILFCGEKLLNTTVEKLFSRFNDIRIINSYGPTECTFAVTSIDITRTLINEENIPVGKPKEDVEIIIVDEKNKEVIDGEIGEILIAGESVADGYLGNVNNKSFIKYNGKNAYLTGDLGYIKNGIIYYKCRKDKQIKYKGYRIELLDIEKNIYSLGYIEKAVVIAKEINNKVTKLIAYVKLKDNESKEEIEIKKDLKERISEYMCPSIKIIDKFPINKNGKCDEKKLLEEY